MKKLVILVPLLLSGCLWQSIDSSDWAIGEDYCKNKDGIVEASSYWSGKISYKCKNNESISQKYAIRELYEATLNK